MTAARDEAAVLRQHGFHSVVVAQLIDETADSRSFVLEIPGELADAFAYRPGQFCTVRAHVDEVELLRSYSMSSAPEVGDPMTLTVKRVPGGVVSNWLCDHVVPGTALELTRPAGVFCVRDGDRPIVAFCGGSGVTPVMSIVKSVLAGTDRHVRILYANRDRGSVIFDEAFTELLGRHPDQLDLELHFDDASGYLDRAVISAFVADTLDADCYLCGPAAFMDLVELTLLDAGVPPDHILIERFANPTAAPTPSLPGEATDDVPAVVTVILKGKAQEIEYKAGDTLLNTARRGGLAPPFSCEAGNCATCMAMLRDGAVTMRANSALSVEEVNEGWVLTCQAVPHGATVTVEYESF